MRVAGIDCGTNSIRLLIADVDQGLTDVVREMTVVRLGQGVDKTGEFAPDALERTFAATEKYAELCRHHGVEAIKFVATSASRDVKNRDEFVSGIKDRLGVEPEVISGAKEAELSFTGAASVLPNVTEPMIVIDLGGGSTEIVVGSQSDGVRAAYSMNVGCVRMTERHLHTDPPTESEQAGAVSDVEAALDEALAHVDLTGVRHIIGLAGTVTTVTAKALDLPAYDPERINGTVLSLDQVREACQWLTNATVEQRNAEGYMHPGRVDVIGAGALVWQTVVNRLASETEIDEVMTSEHDILDGIALWAAR